MFLHIYLQQPKTVRFGHFLLFYIWAKMYLKMYLLSQIDKTRLFHFYLTNT